MGMEGHSGVPIKCDLQKQVLGWIWLPGFSLPNPGRAQSKNSINPMISHSLNLQIFTEHLACAKSRPGCQGTVLSERAEFSPSMSFQSLF